MKDKLSYLWKKALPLIFVWAIYHLIRDILQDIFGVKTIFTEFWHYPSNGNQLPAWLEWTGFYGHRNWISFPLEIIIMLAVPFAWKTKQFSKLDWLIVITLVVFVAIWLVGVIYFR